jgi:hypothetical protein
MKLTPEKRAEFVAAGMVPENFISVGGHDYVVRKPTEPQFARFATEGADAKKAINACRALSNDIVAWPAGDDLARAFAQRPAHVTKIAQYGASLAGTDDEVLVGEAASS